MTDCSSRKLSLKSVTVYYVDPFYILATLGVNKFSAFHSPYVPSPIVTLGDIAELGEQGGSVDKIS